MMALGSGADGTAEGDMGALELVALADMASLVSDLDR